jgi:TM2 domain-containing membrane protein YozV
MVIAPGTPGLNSKQAFKESDNSPRSSDPQVDMLYEHKRKKGLTLFLLWFFPGLLGMHRFYLGNSTSSIIGAIHLFLFIIDCSTGFLNLFLHVPFWFIEGLFAFASLDKVNEKIRLEISMQNNHSSNQSAFYSQANELEKLAALREHGILTEEEFQIEKSKLLNG